MPYSQIEDLKTAITEDLLILLTDDEGMGGINQQRASEAIARADGEIDAYCGGRVSVPFTDPVPALIKQISIEFAVCGLFTRRSGELPPAWAEKLLHANQTLRGIASGGIALGTVLTAQTSRLEQENVFTRETLKEF